MNLVELGELKVSNRVAEAMRHRNFDTAPFLFAHRRGSAGDLQSSEEIFAHITAVCGGLTVRSVHATEHGALHIVTVPDKGRTLLAFSNEINR